MAITYNGTPVTSVLMNGVTYTTIADENGYLYYACNPVCYYGNANACYEFAGFEYCRDNDGFYNTYYARAAMCYNGRQDGNGYVCWVGGPRTCCTNMTYNIDMRFQRGCIWQIISGCGYCGTTYNFGIKDNAKLVGFTQLINGIVSCAYAFINPQDTCTNISGFCWTSGDKIYSDWVEITYCDYCSSLQCTGIENICNPVLLPYCSIMYARLKDGDLICCKFVLNELGSGNTGITCSIRIC